MPEPANALFRDMPEVPVRVPPSARFPYAELEVTTNFSFLRGASHPDELVFRAAELGYSAIGVTDFNTVCGMVRAHEAAQKSGIQLCVGARLILEDGPDVLVWPTDRAAYGRLSRLLTLGKRRAEKGECLLRLNDLIEHSEGLLAAVVHHGSRLEVDPSLSLPLLREAFGDRLSLAVSCLYHGNHSAVLGKAAGVARRFAVPLLATNGVYYHSPARRPLQDVLTCIRHGCTIHDAGHRLFPNSERYLKTPEQMHRLFADYPQAIRRGLEIARQCRFKLDELRYEYPDEVVPAGLSAIAYLTELAWAGAAERYPQGVPDSVRQQIEHELKLIAQLRFEAYFLTVYDLVKFARSRGILCQGRGSAANSAVCYCIGVTSVDPARIDVLFERFVSAARNEPPDIDIDFEHERREEVIQYVYEKYGRERAGMTAEVISYRGRSAIRDVGKAMGLNLDMVDQMAKRLEGWHSGPLDQGRIREAGLDPSDPTLHRVIALSYQLLGFPRHLSQHVGGMVITRGPLSEMVPIENGAMEDRTVIEWDKDDIDAVGILKVDLLGLGMLTCIRKAMHFIDQSNPGAPALELHTIPAEDPGVYDMICEADTVGVFQIESRAQMSMLPRLKPRKFYDLVIEVAIVRPGPIQGDMVHPYLRRRKGEEPVSYPSKALEGVLGKTLGVPLFQEQAMKLVMVGAGFTADEADQLRKSMAAWKRNGAIEGFHQKIITGMLANGYTLDFAERCFLQLKGFGEYGFPESHAASFALLVYASCWIKRYHPAAFAAALLNSQPMGFYAPAQIVRDAREHGVDVRPVDVNHSQWDCTLEDQPTDVRDRPSGKAGWGYGGPALRLGLRMVKSLRLSQVERIVGERNELGCYESIEQFHRRTLLPVGVVELLSDADAFGSLPRSRRQSLWQTLALPHEHLPLDMPQNDSDTGQSLPPMPLWEEVRADYETVGLSLKKHPVAIVRPLLSERGIITAAELIEQSELKRAIVAGLVLVRQRPGTASGVVFVTLEDETGTVQLIVWPKVYDQYRTALRQATLLRAEGRVQREDKVIHIVAERLHDLSKIINGVAVRSRDFH